MNTMKTLLFILIIGLFLSCKTSDEKSTTNAEEQQILNEMQSSIDDTSQMEIIMERDTTY